MSQTTQDRITEILADHFRIAAGTITPDKLLSEDLGADDLDEIEVLMRIEEDFSITINEEALIEVVTVRDLVALVEKTIAAQAPVLS